MFKYTNYFMLPLEVGSSMLKSSIVGTDSDPLTILKLLTGAQNFLDIYRQNSAWSRIALLLTGVVVVVVVRNKVIQSYLSRTV